MAKTLAVYGIYYTRFKPGVINTSLDVALAFNPGKVPKIQFISFKMDNVFSTCSFTFVCELKI